MNLRGGISRFLVIIVFLLINVFIVRSQCQSFNISDTLSDSLLGRVIIGGGVWVSNIKYSGANKARGYFDKSPFSFQKGIALTTGLASNVKNGNSLVKSSYENHYPGDKDLNKLVGGGVGTNDASILEFDFIPNGDSITMNYIFGSDEYPEYVNAGYNDVFGFFITREGFSDTLNIALIPQTLLPVSIDNINNVKPSYEEYYNDNYNTFSPVYNCFSYDGYTKLMRAVASVTPCQKYHLKLAIADAGDEKYDSGVFIEAGSFKSSPVNIKVTTTRKDLDPINVIEGCSDAIVSFVLDKPALEDKIMNIYLGGTASPISDYDAIPSTVTIPKGKDSVAIIVRPLFDTIKEDDETIILNVQKSICSWDVEKIIIKIKDYKIMKVNVTDDFNICPGDAGEIKVEELEGGEGYYNYKWNTGDIGSSIVVSPPSEVIYILTVTDACGNIATDKCKVGISTEVASAGSDISICYGGIAKLVATGGKNYTWNTGERSQNIFVNPKTNTKYWVTIDDGCVKIDTVEVYVNMLPSVEVKSNSELICLGDSVYIWATGGISYHWFAYPGDIEIMGKESLSGLYVSPEESTIYTVYVYDKNGCENSGSIVINVKEELQPSFIFSSNVGCVGEKIKITYTGNALKTASYKWGFYGGEILDGEKSGPYSIRWTLAGYNKVSLEVEDSGCSSKVKLDSIFLFETPEADFEYDINSGCIPLTVKFNNKTNLLPYNTTYLWDFGDGGMSTEENPSYKYTRSDTFSVSLKVTAGVCSSIKTMTDAIITYPRPVSSFAVAPTETDIFNPVVEFTNMSYNYDSLYWVLWDNTIMGGDKFVEIIKDTGVYLVELFTINKYGCRDSLQKSFVVHSASTLYIPNSFTPNNDDRNDIFRVYGIGIKEMEMKIYDRWGREIYYTNDNNKGWDGKIKGKTDYVPSGMYIYWIKVVDMNYKEKTYFGYVNVIYNK